MQKNLATIGIGVGQTNRIDSAKQAIERMKKILAILKYPCIRWFFPFPDIVKICAKIKYWNIIQPGGSLNDNLVIEEAKKIKTNGFYWN